MPDNLAIAQGLYGVTENVPADRLHNILYEFRSITLYPSPFLLGVYAHVCDTLTTELVLTDPWLHVGQATARRKLDEEHTGLPEKLHIADTGRSALLDHCFYSRVDLPPVFYDPGIRLSPHIDQRLQIFFGDAHVRSAHGFQGADAAAVAQGEFRDFAFLPEMAVLSVFLDRDATHL